MVLYYREAKDGQILEEGIVGSKADVAGQGPAPPEARETPAPTGMANLQS